MAHPIDKYLSLNYLESNPTWDSEDAPWKIALVRKMLCKHKIHPNSVYEIGCGSGACLVELGKYYPQTDMYGYDISPSASSFWERNSTDKVKFKLADVLKAPPFSCDVILVLDVLEHLVDPYVFLQAVRGNAKYFIFHIPLDLSSMSVMREKPLLHVRNKVGHIHYFTKKLATALIEEGGYSILDAQYTRAAYHAPVRSWKTWVVRPVRFIAEVLFGKDLAVRILGGETLLILAISTQEGI